jgi:hypothetical protein
VAGIPVTEMLAALVVCAIICWAACIRAMPSLRCWLGSQSLLISRARLAFHECP